MEFRLVGPRGARALADVCSDIDEMFFRPHPVTGSDALRIADHVGRDACAIQFDGPRPVVYGMLRGLDEGDATPSLGIAVRD